MKTDIQIAQEAEMKHIREVAEGAGIAEDELEFYGKYKAKLSDELWERIKDREDGKLVLVTAINPTPAGEGKTTISVGLGICKAWQKISDRITRTISWTMLWNQRRSSRWRLFTGGSDGGSESSFHGRFSCHHFCQQSAGSNA